MWHKENDKSEKIKEAVTDSIMAETSDQLVKPIPSPLKTFWANADELLRHGKQRDPKNKQKKNNQKKKNSGNNGNEHEHNKKAKTSVKKRKSNNRGKKSCCSYLQDL